MSGRAQTYALAMSGEIAGRDAELATIGAFLDGLAAAPGALVLAGPPGAGQTRDPRGASARRCAPRACAKLGIRSPGGLAAWLRDPG